MEERLGQIVHKMKLRKTGNKKAKVDVVGVVVGIAILVALVPVVASFIQQGVDVYECQNPDLPIWNQTFELCTNASGVGVVNESGTHVGLGATEEALLLLTILFLVLAFVFVVVKESGLMKKK